MDENFKYIRNIFEYLLDSVYYKYIHILHC